MRYFIHVVLAYAALAFALPQRLAASSSPGSLDAKFRAKGKKYFGTIVDRNTLSNAQNVNIARTEFGQVTAENRFVPM